MFSYLEKGYQYLTDAVQKGNTFLFVAILFCLSLLIEWLVLYFRGKQKLDYKDGLANIVTGQLSAIKRFLFGNLLPLVGITYLYNHSRIFTLPLTWWGLLLAFIYDDLIGYFSHVIAHKTGFFWAFHQVHHSSQQFNPSLASRFSIFDAMLLSKPLFYLLPILGVSPVQYLVAGLIQSVWGIFQHTEVIRKLPVIDFLLSSPSNHRVHHGVNVKYLDKNFGEMFIFWDRIFGTFQKEEEESKYGLTKNINTYNIITIQTSGLLWLFKQMQSATKVSDKLKYLYKPPGWNHTGPGTSTKELVALEKRNSERFNY